METIHHHLSIPISLALHVNLQQCDWTVWWIFCFRVQASFQNQGIHFPNAFSFVRVFVFNIFNKCTMFNVMLLLLQDFGDLIPGHGGFLDRFDCQILMATFVNVYLTSFIRIASPQKLLQQVS